MTALDWAFSLLDVARIVASSYLILYGLNGIFELWDAAVPMRGPRS